MRGESWRLRTDALSVGTGVGTEKGGGRLEARRDLSPSQRERARGQRRERSERAGPDLSGLTSFFLCPSASFTFFSFFSEGRSSYSFKRPQWKEPVRDKKRSGIFIFPHFFKLELLGSSISKGKNKPEAQKSCAFLYWWG